MFARSALVATGLAGGLSISWAASGDAPPTASIPRTARAVSWAAYAAWDYAALAKRYPDPKSTEYKQGLVQLHDKHAVRLLQVCERNGGVYTKAAQFGSALQAIPVEYRRVLEKLQDQAPPRPFAQVQRVLRAELHEPLETLFLQFDPTPAAAASLAQVHRAVLRGPDGSEIPVAVKVQYEGLEAEVRADLSAARALSAAVRWLFPRYDTAEYVVGEIARGLARELDFEGEVRNAQRLQESCKGHRAIAVPRAFEQLCTPRVLTMEWVDGCKINDTTCMRHCRLRAREVALALTDAIAFMTYETGSLHADPHAGNILVRPNSNQGSWLSRWLRGGWLRPQLVFLDHGTYVQLPDDLRLQYCQLWCAFVLRDRKTARAVATAMAGERAGRVLPEVLQPRDWGAVPSAERRRLQKDAGVNTLGDVSRLLEECPQPLVEVLRIGAVVRPLATQLGATVHDRLRINATHALRGMAHTRDPGGKVTFMGDLASRRKRWRLSSMIWAMRSMFWMADVWNHLLVRVGACTLLD